MKGLPELRYKSAPYQQTQATFSGLNRRASAGDGEIVNMRNMSSDEMPVLSPRKSRKYICLSTFGIYALDKLVTVALHVDSYEDSTVRVWYGDTMVEGTVSESQKTITALGSKIVILPDKVYFDTSSETPKLLSIDAEVKNVKVKLQDGEYAGEDAKANTIYAEGVMWKDYFSVGDAVTISGAFLHTQNNITIVVREIDGNYLRFYENSFIIGKGGDDENLTVARTMPDMDYICECNNRLWGCKGDTVYASKLGDLTNWNVFDGISSDSWTVNVGSPGEFTGCITYLGYPVFFKEDVIYKAYGTQPSNFQLIRSASLGVAPGNSRSLAIAGEILFYMSRTGIVAYSGSTPYDIFLPFDNEKFTDCVAGSDGRKYYVSMKKGDGKYILAVYDTSFSVWHIEDNTQATGFTFLNGLYMQTAESEVYLLNSGNESISSAVEFADSTLSAPNKKTLQKIGLRVTVEDGASLTVKVRYDSIGEWENIRTLEGKAKRSYYLPVIPRRCDHFRLKLEGIGRWQLHSITREYSYNSMKG